MERSGELEQTLVEKLGENYWDARGESDASRSVDALGSSRGGQDASTSSAWVAGLTFRSRLDDRAVGADHEGRADDAHVRAAVARLLAPDAVGLGDRVVGVGEQRERQLVFALELHVRRDAVGRDAEHDRAGRLELAPRVADPARLRRAARTCCPSDRSRGRPACRAATESFTVSPVSLVSSKSGQACLLRPRSHLSGRVAPRCYRPTTRTPSS